MTEKEALQLLVKVNELGTTIMALTKRLEDDQGKLAVEEVENAGKQWEELKEVVLKLVDETRLRVPTAR
jgi:phosphoribosylaminoimidazole-succinocarboxamide synthase